MVLRQLEAVVWRGLSPKGRAPKQSSKCGQGGAGRERHPKRSLGWGGCQQAWEAGRLEQEAKAESRAPILLVILRELGLPHAGSAEVRALRSQSAFLPVLRDLLFTG